MQIKALSTGFISCLVTICLLSSAECVEPGAWSVTSLLAAPEAVQAAAADKQFAYAVSNTQVAKYNRKTGQRVAVSTGEAKHLNSAFFHDGVLYCAHSNYPQVPAKSELKALNTATMQLTEFHDFGDQPGSLTWAVYHKNHWWCNFAHYGKENARTYLVKFNTEWQEQGRWTYPQSVIEKLGNYSLSGGLWREDELLVTGHDDPLVFRLRLPKSDQVLEYLGEERVPFTGQGLAYDPLTKGLIGIHRAKRQIVFAEASLRNVLQVRVLTYNIHHGAGIDGKLDLERIAAVIAAVKPDVVALQEVDKKVARSGNVDQPAELARLTKMRVAFGANLPLGNGQYGNAVLSRFPIVKEKNHLLPRLDQGEPRGVLELEIDLGKEQPPLYILATHFDHRENNRERIASAKFINERLSQRPDASVVLAGDLNDVPESDALAELARNWRRLNENPLPTVPVDKPMQQIDYILVSPAQRWKVLEMKVLSEAVASDHRALLAVIELQSQLHK